MVQRPSLPATHCTDGRSGGGASPAISGGGACVAIVLPRLSIGADIVMLHRASEGAAAPMLAYRVALSSAAGHPPAPWRTDPGLPG
jgi:hypothetical protein